MSNKFNDDRFTEIFDIEPEKTTSIAKCEDDVMITSATETDINTQLSVLLNKSSGLLDIALDTLTQARDAESIEATAKLIDSMKNIISEFNKSVLTERKFKNALELEIKKAEIKKQMMEHKAVLAQQNNIHGNVNIQNNNLITFSQEQLVDQILEKTGIDKKF